MAEYSRAGRLAVILHADVAGSTNLVQRNEGLAHDRIQDAFRRFGKTIAEYHGVVCELRGDALLAKFDRASDAVSAALAHQRADSRFNSKLGDGIVPEIRVGISLGEVVIADGTVTGAGVVMAQRVEQLAAPGAVCISGAIREALPKRLGLAFEDLGQQALKGFEHRVHVHRVVLPAGADVPPPEPFEGPPRKRTTPAMIATGLAGLLFVVGLAWWQPWQPDTEPASLERLAFELPDEPSIAVMPFKNVSGDSKQDYLADGITEEIVTRLSMTPELFVIARQSTDVYKDKPGSPKTVAEEQGVRYVLEGSVQQAGDRIRINARLVDALEGDHVWVERYDYALDNLFAVQDDITHKLAVAMQVNLTQGDEVSNRSARTTNFEVFQLTERAIWHFRKFTREDSVKARELVLEALRIAPDDIGAMRMGAWVDYQQGRFGWGTPRDELLERSEAIARKTLALDPEDPENYFQLSFLLPLRGNLDEAIEMGRKAVEMRPNHANAVAGLGTNLAYAGRPREAIPLLQKAMRLSPHYPVWFDSAMGLAQMMAGNYREAVPNLEKVIASGRLLAYTHARLAGVYVLQGDMENARAQAAKVLQVKPDFSIQEWAKSLPYKQESDLQRELDAVAQSGLPWNPPLALPDKPSIAVLPFRSLGGDANQQYMADGLTENVTSALASIPDLFVIARGSTAGYKGKTVTPRQVARAQGVRYVLDGSVQASGERLRVTAQLTDTQTDKAVWSERYDRQVEDIFDVQDDITLNIAKPLASDLTEYRFTDNEGSTRNLDAWLLYVRGLEKYNNYGQENILLARDLFSKATALDPSFVNALVMEGFTYYLSARFGWEPLEEAAENAERTIDRVRSIDPDRPGLHRLAGAIHLLHGEHEQAVAAADRAVQLGSGEAINHAFRAWFLYETSRHQESVEAWALAIRQSPMHSSWWDFFRIRAYAFLGDYDKALQLAEEAMLRADSAQNKMSLLVSTAFVHAERDDRERGDLERARAQMSKAVELSPTLNQTMWVSFYRYQKKEDLDRFMEAMEKAGMPK